jgi:hypothetical protein
MAALSRQYIEDLLTLLRATTPGPWTSFVEGRDHESGSSFIRTRTADIELSAATPADQDFMARAHQDIPLLIAEIERLEALLAGMQTAAE